jgi:aryl-alcohol dehydrogenase-like predicted oxidoreductase
VAQQPASYACVADILSVAHGSVAREVGATPAQVALAWLVAKGDDIVPIPGTKRVSRAEENIAAEGIQLSAEQIDRLNNLARPPAPTTTRSRCG